MIYLASRSPRRRELLAQIGVRFEPLLFREGTRSDPDTSEDVLAGEQADEYVRRVANAKAEAAWKRVTMRRGLSRRPESRIRHCRASDSLSAFGNTRRPQATTVSAASTTAPR